MLLAQMNEGEDDEYAQTLALALALAQTLAQTLALALTLTWA